MPIAPDPAWVEKLRASIPQQPSLRRAGLATAWGISAFDMESLVNAGVLALVEAAVADGVAPDTARKWWAGELLRQANDRGVPPQELAVTGADILRVDELIATGALNDQLARQVFDGVLLGEGSVDDVVAARGLGVVTDETELLAAIDQALADQPEVAEKIRAGKIAAAGAIVGGVMKATGGRADASRVRELILSRCEVSG